MKTIEEIFSALKEKFGDGVKEAVTNPVDPYITADPLIIDEISLFLRDEPAFLFDSLILLSGVDDANGKTINLPEGGSVIEGGTLSVYYHMESTSLKHKICFKVSAPRENPEVKSVSQVWEHANWEEREAYDMFGIKFLNHPNLTRILMPYDWEDGSYPLRKDYKSPEFYHGMKIPY